MAKDMTSQMKAICPLTDHTSDTRDPEISTSNSPKSASGSSCRPLLQVSPPEGSLHSQGVAKKWLSWGYDGTWICRLAA